MNTESTQQKQRREVSPQVLERRAKRRRDRQEKARPGIFQYIAAKDMSLNRTLAVLAILAAVVIIPFMYYHGRPVPQYPDYFPEKIGYQNSDMSDWLFTGLAFPHWAVPIRAPRPLYPSFIKISQWLGFTDSYTLHRVKPPQHIIQQARHVMAGSNILLTFCALWLFFSCCRYFAMEFPDALFATILAGSGFGFTFWTAQLVPEVLSYFSVILALTLMIWAAEKSGDDATMRSRLIKWGAAGLIIGILLLGKELYFLPLIGALYLVWRKKWPEIVVFIATCAVPVLLWRYYITDVIHIFDQAAYNEKYGYIVWFKETLFQVPFSEKISRLGDNFYRQVLSTLQAFVFAPVLFAVIGVIMKPVKKQWIPLLIFGLSFSAMFFVSNFIFPRICFMIWPLVYFFAWRGIEYITSKLSPWLSRIAHGELIVKSALLIALIAVQNIEVYAHYYYG